MALLGPVDAVSDQRPSGVRQFDSEAGEELGPGGREFVAHVVTGLAQRILVGALSVIPAVTAGEDASFEQTAHDADAQLAREVVVTGAGRAQPRSPGALA
jgi:hypothetical protein